MATIAGAVLVGSHVAQAIWGPKRAKKYNEELKSQQVKWEPLVVPTEDSVIVGLSWHF